ncbi:MAG: hypothetical protein JW395_0858 [Nitrospira sp.]|nr:hypothetical protein [Nitrospira sp.]
MLDIQLEGMSGLELRQKLAAVHDGTPVVFVTAHDNPAVRAEAKAASCAGYFRKADSGALVLEAIHKAVAQSALKGRSQAANKPR